MSSKQLIYACIIYMHYLRVVCHAGDFTLASAAPLHAMLQEGIIDKNVKFTPVLDNLRMPDYIDWELRPFTNHTVSKDAC